MLPIDFDRASAILREIVKAFWTECRPGIVADCDEALGDKEIKEIAAGRKIDTRVPRVLSVSGKGGPGHHGWRNVTYFDHTSSVGMGAARMAVTDAIGGGVDDATARRIGAVALAVGFLHDVDKLAGVDWRQVDAAVMERFYVSYGVRGFLDTFAAPLSAEQMLALVAYDEVRSAHRAGTAARVPDVLVDVVRRYVRFADVLDSIWLKSDPATQAQEVADRWAAELAAGRGSVFRNPQAFSAFRPLVVSDPHHSFLLEEFAGQIEAASVEHGGAGVLFQVLSDEVLVTLLPEDRRDDIVDAAIAATCESIPFEFGIMVGTQGVPKVTGSKPTWRAIEDFVHERLPSGDLRRIASVKTADWRRRSEELAAVASAAGCPVISPKPDHSAATWTPVPSPAGPEAPEFQIVERVTMIALAVGVQECTTDKALTRPVRLKALSATLGETAPWLSELDPMTQCTALAWMAAARCAADPRFSDGMMGMLRSWFEPGALFRDMDERGSVVREAVARRLRALCSGEVVIAPDEAAPFSCLITGEPVGGEPISGPDGLYEIATSAVSYRPGRPEEKFTEKAGTWVSDVTRAEYRLRAAAHGKSGLRAAGIPVALSSPRTAGAFSLSLAPLEIGAELGLYDINRKDASKRVYKSMSGVTQRTRVGRYESLPATFAHRGDTPGRVTFFKLAMEAALRYGAAIHVFCSLPYPRPEFFYTDCLDPELRQLLGGDGFRIEEIPDAVGKLGMVEVIAKDLRSVDLAKAFCRPMTSFAAACQAWCSARDTKEFPGDVMARISTHLNEELTQMDNDGSTSRAVQLGRLAAAVQAKPRYEASSNDEQFMWKKAYEAACECWTARYLRDRESIVSAVASTIQEDGDRRQGSRGFYAAKANRGDLTIDESLVRFAEMFADIWFGEFGGRPPSAATRKLYASVYRWAFLQAPRARKPETPGTDGPETAEPQAA